ncbi:MAG: HAMP domain-containing sensor histidine kinase [Chitinophagales bacterium]
MQIRQKLTYQFIVIVAILLTVFSLSIYFVSASYRKTDFYERLQNKATNVASLLIDVDEIDVDLLHRIEKDNPGTLPHEKIEIYNFNDSLLYNSNDDYSFVLSNDLLDEVRLDRQITLQQGEYEMIGFLFTSKYDRFVVMAGATDIYGIKRLHFLRTILFIAFGISMIILFFMGRIYAGRALKPISNIIGQVNNIGINSMNLRLDEGDNKDEIAQLAHTFNDMLERLEEALRMQKDFISNASHELRNPLTSLSGQLEVLLMQERTTEYYQQSIRSLLGEMKSLIRISNRLLLLAQASSQSTETAFKEVRIDDVLWQAHADLIKRNPDYKVYIKFDSELDASDLTVKGSDQLLKSAFLNLMDNGCKYSAQHKVSVVIGMEDNMVNILFRDNGIGIPEEDMEHIYEPFHRGSNVEKIRGHGIGLSLVYRIVQLHQGSISIQSKTDAGTTITVQLPVFQV